MKHLRNWIGMVVLVGCVAMVAGCTDKPQTPTNPEGDPKQPPAPVAPLVQPEAPVAPPALPPLEPPIAPPVAPPVAPVPTPPVTPPVAPPPPIAPPVHAGPAPKVVSTFVIDAKVFKKYPAAFVSFDTGKMESADPLTQGRVVVADLWIEPNDPEIAGLKAKFEGMVHPGKDTYVSASTLTYDEITKSPPNIIWDRKLHKAAIVKGGVFLVSSSTGQIFKVRFDEVTKASIKLTFAKLK